MLHWELVRLPIGHLERLNADSNPLYLQRVKWLSRVRVLVANGKMGEWIMPGYIIGTQTKTSIGLSNQLGAGHAWRLLGAFDWSVAIIIRILAPIRQNLPE